MLLLLFMSWQDSSSRVVYYSKYGDDVRSKACLNTNNDNNDIISNRSRSSSSSSSCSMSGHCGGKSVPHPWLWSPCQSRHVTCDLYVGQSVMILIVLILTRITLQ